MQHLDTTVAPAVPWRFVLENAALFLPEHSKLLFADSMIYSELREMTKNFIKVQAKLYLPETTPPTRTLDLVEAPLWKAFGMQGPRSERPWLAKMFSFILWDDA
jgi:hypothetical protein